MPNEGVQNISNEFNIVSCFVRNLVRLEFPSDRFYTLKHTWVKLENDFATVGVSASIILLFAPFVEIIFLNVPTLVKKDAPCVWMVHRDGILTIRSPVEGKLYEINESLLQSPNIINLDPYFSGWLFKIEVDKAKLSGLLSCSEFLRIYNESVESFQREIFSALSNSIELATVPTVQNGGKIVETVKDLLGAKRYFSLVSKTFRLF